MEKNLKLPNSFTSNGPLKGAKNSIWPATFFLLRRNLESHPFPSKLTPKQAEEILSQIEKSFSTRQIIPSNSLSPHQKELLFEHFILDEGFERQDNGRAFIVDDSAKFLGLVNVGDHLHLHHLSLEPNFSNPWKFLSNLEQSLSKSLTFSYSPRFGFLTSRPSVCGTGLLIRSLLHVPALLHLDKFPEILESLPEEISIKGLGNEGEYLGDFVLLENAFTLGVSEEAILESVQSMAKSLVLKESELRKNLDPSQAEILKDATSRSLGLLSNAYSLEVNEALSSLSLIHLGSQLGWLQAPKEFDFFELFFSCRRTHLLELTQSESIKEARAAHLRNAVSNINSSKLFK
jgi:protein arginine kinase